jgi:sodium-dependent dicarboxylate transporter 2/3/5
MAIKAPGATDKAVKKRIIGFIIAVLIIAIFVLIPPFDGLDDPAMASIGIFLGAIVMFVCQVAPLAIISLTLMVLLPYFGIMDLTTIYSKFGGTSFFFVMFAFGVTGALSQTTIPLRISAWITKISKGNPKILVFGFTLATCIISGFLSNFATLIMFYGIVLMFLKVSGCEPGKSALGRCLMIGLPMAAGTGGIITPAGSPGNLIAMQLLEAQGITITFLDWFLMMTPFAILACLILCVFLCALFKPEPLSQEACQSVQTTKNELGAMNRKEKIAIAIILITVVLWFSSTWFPILNTTVVAGCACFLMFMPGIDLMDWKSYVGECDFNLLFMVGSVAITMGCVNETGAMSWVMNKLFSGLGGMPIFLVFLIVGFVICYLRVFIPTAPSVAAIFIPVLIGISDIIGGYTVALAMIPVFWAGATMTLMYTEPIYLYTNASGYYTAGDLFKVGLIPTLLLIVIIAAVFPGWFALFGY